MGVLAHPGGGTPPLHPATGIGRRSQPAITLPRAEPVDAQPDRVFQQRETAGRVWQALDALPFDQRAVIVLREIDGLSYEEIATSLNVAVGTVKSRLARARDTLRELLKSHDRHDV